MGSTRAALTVATAVVIMGIGALSDIPPEAKKLLKELEKDFPEDKSVVDKRAGALIEQARVISEDLEKSIKSIEKLNQGASSLRDDVERRLDKDSARVKHLEKILNVTKASVEKGKKAASVGNTPPEAKKLLKELDKGIMNFKGYVDTNERKLEEMHKLLAKHLQNAKEEMGVILQGGKKMRKSVKGTLDTDLAKVKRLEKVLNVTTSAVPPDDQNGGP